MFKKYNKGLRGTNFGREYYVVFWWWNFANGRDVRNYFEMAIVNQANRLAGQKSISDEALSKLEVEDVVNITL